MKPQRALKKRITRAIVGAALGAGIGMGTAQGMRTHYERQTAKANAEVRQNYKEMPGSTPLDRLPTKEEIARLQANIKKLKENQASAQKWEKRSPKAGKIGLAAGGIAGFVLGGPRKGRKPQKKP